MKDIENKKEIENKKLAAASSGSSGSRGAAPAIAG